MKILRTAALVLVSIFFTTVLSAPLLYAQGEVGVIPRPAEETDCRKDYARGSEKAKLLENPDAFKTAIQDDRSELPDILGCAVQLGKIRLYMMPFFLTYLIQFLLGLAGLIAVLFIVIGGYKYVIGGLTADKESGKKTLIHAIVGLLIALSAWIIVNFVQVALTS